MAPKRKQDGDGTVESQDPLAKQESDSMQSSAEFAKPVYLVAVHYKEQSAYSVLKVDAAAAVAGGNTPPRAETVAGLPGADPGMSFVAVHSKHGSWIVGAGGLHTVTSVILDPSTLEMIDGPRLLYPKRDPVVISHDSKVYVMSRSPQLVPFTDFEPWFESLSFENGVSGIAHDYLPPPPFFPICVDPYEFRYPTKITVSSYAALGSHIFLSPQQELAVGTYAFHVVNKTWEKVHDKNLPFVGEAVPLGGGLFAACPISNNVITASASIFLMSFDATAASSSQFSIQEFPVWISDDKIPRPLFCALGKDSFCSIRMGSVRQSGRHANRLEKVEVILTGFKMENIEATLTACQAQGARTKDMAIEVQVKEQSHEYTFKRRSRLLACDMPVIAALSMDRQNIEPFQGGTTETRASGAANSAVFEATVIGYGK